MTVYPRSSEKQMTSRLGVDHMKLMCDSYRPYSYIKIYKTYGVGVITSKARHLDRVALLFCS